MNMLDKLGLTNNGLTFFLMHFAEQEQYLILLKILLILYQMICSNGA